MFVLLLLSCTVYLVYLGGSCFPLSDDAGKHMDRNERLDQLSVIFSVIGTPCEEDVTSIGEVQTFTFVNTSTCFCLFVY